MNGICHELWLDDNVIPERIGLPIDNIVWKHKRRIAWYRIEDGVGIYLWTRNDEE